MLSVNAAGTSLSAHDPTLPLDVQIRRGLAGTGPVIVMVHGFRYSPFHRAHCPHSSLFAIDEPSTARHASSWPRALGFKGQHPDEGLAISFGWHARGTIWQAYRESGNAATALAELIARLRRIAPHRDINLIAHSLGARVCLEALARSAPGAVSRAILLAGAVFRRDAERALATPGGRSCDVFNVTSPENAVFDLMFETLLGGAWATGPAIGREALSGPRVITLDMGQSTTLQALANMGFEVEPPRRRPCHWSLYARRGMLPLYRALLAEAPRLHLSLVRAHLEAARPAGSRPATLLPFARQE